MSFDYMRIGKFSHLCIAQWFH